jgi:hypothetical protein
VRACPAPLRGNAWGRAQGLVPWYKRVWQDEHNYLPTTPVDYTKLRCVPRACICRPHPLSQRTPHRTHETSCWELTACGGCLHSSRMAADGGAGTRACLTGRWWRRRCRIA